ncbi:SHOCT domain-containing protein [Streptomyces galilaeus]|uniref:SHOCT domain-containing protein n=1 Tax=Streptomyces galilaeus TaxID=33899 RepID=UPI001E30E5E9|nr:SHOCT domain-containing protein [Streptomyces galilaeus]
MSAFWTMLWFFLWIMWIFLFVKIVFDIFRDDSLGGWGKAGWLVFVLVLPFLGVFVYLIARGRDMGRREVDHALQQRKVLDAYVKETAASGPPTPSGADELAKLSELHAHGDITAEEFQKAKNLVLTGSAAAGGAASTPPDLR